MAATTRWRDTVSENINTAIDSLIDDVISDEKVTRPCLKNKTCTKNRKMIK